MKWVLEDVDLLLAKAKEGLGYPELGVLLGRTGKSVKEKLNKLGFSYSSFNIKIEPECKTCKKKIPNRRSFCCRSCAATFNNKGRTRVLKNKNCPVCKISYRGNQKHCSRNCQKLSKEILLESKIKAGEKVSSKAIKKYLILKYGNKCMDCGWCEINKFTGNVPIELEHVDGNYLNNNLNNLKLLCPNCHSLTPTYKALNSGNGRHSRRLRFREGKSY